ncbi:MAG: hypothetical protein ACLS8Q_04400 [Anaerovoracaceae bacterium]
MGEGLETNSKEIVRASSMAGFISSMVSKRYGRLRCGRLTTYVLMEYRAISRNEAVREVLAGSEGRSC